MKPATPYIALHQRKRTWTPVQVSAGTLLEGGEDVIKRGLALRCLEIPVGDFIEEAIGVTCLMSGAVSGSCNPT